MVDDITVLYNDWPYGLDPKIVHLVVWTKFELDDDPDTGEVITAMRGLIEKYVDETFKSKILAENVREISLLSGLTSCPFSIHLSLSNAPVVSLSMMYFKFPTRVSLPITIHFSLKF